MSRRRSSTQPQFIQLQPYRALVGVPVKDRRSGIVHSLIGGAVKGTLFSLVAVGMGFCALAYSRGGFGAIGSLGADELRWIAAALVTGGLMGAAWTVLRR